MAMTKTTTVNADFDIDIDAVAAESNFIDPELDRDNWPIIIIGSEEGKPNYEYVASHGTMKDGQPFSHELQIMRDVEVAVPPSIVNNLKTAKSTHFKYVKMPDGTKKEVRQDRYAIPWTLVKPGKYVTP